jgi:hypothetical protein
VAPDARFVATHPSIDYRRVMRSLLVIALVCSHAVGAHAASTEPNAPPPLLDDVPDPSAPRDEPAPLVPDASPEAPDNAPRTDDRESPRGDNALPPADPLGAFSAERAFGAPTWWGVGGCAGAYLTSGACAGVGVMAFIMGALFAIGGSSVEAATILLVVGVGAIAAGAVLFPLAPCIAAGAAIVGALTSGKDVEPVLLGALPGILMAAAGAVLVLGAAVPAVGGVIVAGAGGLLLLAGPAVVVGVALSTGFDFKVSTLLSDDPESPTPRGAPKRTPAPHEGGPLQARAMRF